MIRREHLLRLIDMWRRCEVANGTEFKSDFSDVEKLVWIYNDTHKIDITAEEIKRLMVML
jgi:hypothetical protein